MAKPPTVDAENNFNHANLWLSYSLGASLDAKNDPKHTHNLVMSLSATNLGLANLAVGLRATYMKLEEIERLLKQPRR